MIEDFFSGLSKLGTAIGLLAVLLTMLILIHFHKNYDSSDPKVYKSKIKNYLLQYLLMISNFLYLPYDIYRERYFSIGLDVILIAVTYYFYTNFKKKDI